MLAEVIPVLDCGGIHNRARRIHQQIGELRKYRRCRDGYLVWPGDLHRRDRPKGASLGAARKRLGSVQAHLDGFRVKWRSVVELDVVPQVEDPRMAIIALGPRRHEGRED